MFEYSLKSPSIEYVYYICIIYSLVISDIERGGCCRRHLNCFPPPCPFHFHPLPFTHPYPSHAHFSLSICSFWPPLKGTGVQPHSNTISFFLSKPFSNDPSDCCFYFFKFVFGLSNENEQFFLPALVFRLSTFSQFLSLPSFFPFPRLSRHSFQNPLS